MTFTHEGNRTLLDNAGLINFEKMHMLAQTMRTLRYCRSRQLRNFLTLIELSSSNSHPFLDGFAYLVAQCCNPRRHAVNRRSEITSATWGWSITSASWPASRSDSNRNGPNYQTHITRLLYSRKMQSSGVQRYWPTHNTCPHSNYFFCTN